MYFISFRFSFRKYAVPIISLQFMLLLGVAWWHQIRIAQEEQNKVVIAKILTHKLSQSHEWRQNNTSSLLDFMHDRAERGNAYDGLQTRSWKMRKFTDQFISELKNKPTSEITSNIRQIIENYYEKMMQMQYRKYSYKIWNDWFNGRTSIDSLIRDTLDYQILQKRYATSQAPISFDVCLEKIKSEVRRIEHRMIDTNIWSSSMYCGYSVLASQAQGQKKLLQGDTLHLKVGIPDPILHQFYDLVIGGDTISVDEGAWWKIPTHKFKPQTVGNHTLEGIILKKDGWGRIARYPFEHSYRVVP